MKKTNALIINTKNQEKLVEHLFVANSFFSRFMGLMGTDPLQDKQGLLISPCQQIHTHFMRFTADIIFLDKYLKVLHVVRGMQPWRISAFIKHAYYVLEIPENSAKNVQIDDILIIHNP